MIRCVAIDDEPSALEVIKSHVSRIPFLELKETFLNPIEASNYLRKNDIDLLFLDINMPDISGLQFARNLNTSPLIIFTTAHSEYAIESYEVDALDYLLKPFDFPRFFAAVTKAEERLKSNPEKTSDFFFVNTGNQKKRFFYDEIKYIEGEGNYVCYYLKNEKTLVRSSIRETIKILPDSAFIQIHRSFIVSLKWIEKIEDNHVHVADKSIPISATYKESFTKRIDELKA